MKLSLNRINIYFIIFLNLLVILELNFNIEVLLKLKS